MKRKTRNISRRSQQVLITTIILVTLLFAGSRMSPVNAQAYPVHLRWYKLYAHYHHDPPVGPGEFEIRVQGICTTEEFKAQTGYDGDPKITKTFPWYMSPNDEIKVALYEDDVVGDDQLCGWKTRQLPQPGYANRIFIHLQWGGSCDSCYAKVFVWLADYRL